MTSRVNEESHSLPANRTLIRKWNEPHLPLLTSRRATPHFGWYSFLVRLRVYEAELAWVSW